MTVLSVIGVSYKTAPAEVRERFVVAEANLLPAVRSLRTIPEVEECLLLSTCNRTEIYLVSPVQAPLAQVLERLGAPSTRLEDLDVSPVYVHRGLDAALHVLRVTAGLDSMVLGEGQILGQVRRAFEVARAAETTGPILNRLMQVAISAGRRVRRDTRLAHSAPSVPRTALMVCRTALGALRGRRLLVVGAGDIAALVIKEFAVAGVTVVGVANRTLESARTLAAVAGAEALALDGVSLAARTVDIIVACAAVSEPILSPQMLGGIHDGRRPLLVIDLGIPRCVDPAVRSLPGITLYDLDALSPEVTNPLSADDFAKAEQIVAENLGMFERWLASRTAAPVLRALQRQVERIVDLELARLRTLDGQQREAVRSVVEAALRKLLHGPMVHLREAAIRHDQKTLEVAKGLFDVDTDASGSQT